MTWLLDVWNDISDWLPVLLSLSLLAVNVASIAWILMNKPNATSAVAWCLVILFLPYIGAILLVLFGYQQVHLPLKRKRRHKLKYQLPPYPRGRMTLSGKFVADAEQALSYASPAESLAVLADRYAAYPRTSGNHIDFYPDGRPAFDAMLEAIRTARHHIHVEKFIFQPDNLGKQFIDELTRKAREGIEIRLLYDAMGSHRLGARLLRPLIAEGGQTSVFLPLNLLRRRFQINMRNHRKIVIVDGNVAFVGGLNIGDEYLGLHPHYGYWRDTHMKIQGPAVGDLQRVFSEDWSFAAGENLTDPEEGGKYFHPREVHGPYDVQIVESGPDRDLKSIRELYFAAILKARKRVWIASPYFVPDEGLLDALRLAGYLGVDVRFLGQLQPDKWIPQYAARYYWGQVLTAGVKVYQYAKGMMHSKVILVDDDWATVGTANLDNRSLHLNFEVNCVIYSPEAVSILAEAFERDLQDAIRLDRLVYGLRPLPGRLLENACRLLSPVL
jgi:cardiolipin synthase